MKSSTRLDSVVFQLTPTRTRCELVIHVNGKTEKIASGLLNPFLSHLKTAQEQMAKGGYSIILEPGHGVDASWFTKGTLERFVRFVSTPEILERVYTTELEILQIEEAIAIQSKNDTGVDEHPPKPVDSIEGSRPTPDTNEEKAIVLYNPGSNPSESSRSTLPEENSRVQLLKVLETRKTALQKEQGMAFARAAAAGLDIDHMAPLISFAECFGASRLMEACKKFMDLWKKKHETGQWVEIEAAEVMSSKLEFFSMNASGIMLTNGNEAQNELASDTNGKTTDERPSLEHQASQGHQEYFRGQFPHQMFPPWPIHSSPGAVPMYPAYPQGMPYYQNYPGNGPYFQPPYLSSEDPRLNNGQRMRRRRHSMDCGEENTESETWEVDAPKARSKDDSELDNEASPQVSQKKGSRSEKKRSGMVVIRNINYITSNKDDLSGGESQSASDSEIDEEDGNLHVKTVSNMGDRVYGKEDNAGHWQAFQNCLLREADDDKGALDQGMFAMEKDVRRKRQPGRTSDDPLIHDGRVIGSNHEGDLRDVHQMSGSRARVLRVSDDELLGSMRNDGRNSVNDEMDTQATEIYGRKGAYKSTASDDFIIQRRDNLSGFTSSSSDPLAINGLERRNNSMDGKTMQNMDDDSYIVPFRSISQDQAASGDGKPFSVDSEFPSANQEESLTNGAGSQVNYEPVELCLMPDRGAEKGLMAYDPALDYEMQVVSGGVAVLDKRGKEAISEEKRGPKKSEKDCRSKLRPDTLDKKKNVGPIRKGKPSKLSPLEEARARAEKLRTYKADLQRMKKEREEENMKRLETLKLERQKRIAAKGTSVPAQSSLPLPQARKQLPAKLSPSSHKGSKFSDAEPGSLSPLQRSIKATIGVSPDGKKHSKSSRLSTEANSAGNRLTRSVSSLSEARKNNSDATPDTKASMARIRRLSEPKLSSNHLVSSAKSRSAESLSRSRIARVPESKKVSAIMNLDKSKAAALPELKIRTPKTTNVTQSKSTAKEEVIQTVNGTKSSSTMEGSKPTRDLDKVSHHGDADDNPVVEKTVVMLEHGKPSLCPVHLSNEKLSVKEGQYSDLNIGAETELGSNYVAIRAPVSPLEVNTVHKEPCERELEVQQSPCEAKISGVEKEPQEFSTTNIAEMPYQAPYARVSSMEEPCTTNSDYAKSPPPNFGIPPLDRETVKVQVSDPRTPKLEKIPETPEKDHVKETTKGFRRLLKFGRKKHSSSAAEPHEPDIVSVSGSEADDNAVNSAPSGEVYTLKNLISQDETTTGTLQKSRTFSLLSPFRSKTSEKKQTA